MDWIQEEYTLAAHKQRKPRMSAALIEQFGKSLRLRRERRGWSQDECAKRLRAATGDVLYKGKESISAIENGQMAPPWPKAMEIAHLFETTIEEMCGLSPPSAPAAHTHADVIYVNNVEGNCLLGGLGLAVDPEMLQRLGDVLQLHPDLVTHLAELLLRWSSGRRQHAPEDAGVLPTDDVSQNP